MKDLITKNKDLQSLLDQPVTRQQFIKHMGMVLLSLVGINALISAVLHPNKHIASHKSTKGFGGGKFGV